MYNILPLWCSRSAEAKRRKRAVCCAVREHEPASALFAGPEGLDDYRVLLPQTAALLTKGGIAIFEMGATQENALSGIARNQGFAPRFCNDLANRPRAMIVSQSF